MRHTQFYLLDCYKSTHTVGLCSFQKNNFAGWRGEAPKKGPRGEAPKREERPLKGGEERPLKALRPLLKSFLGALLKKPGDQAF